MNIKGGGLTIFLFLVIGLSYAADDVAQTPLAKGETMKFSSPVFKNNQTIPSKFTCEGDDINPPLTISDIPPDAKSLALIVDDPDAPMGTWVHWVVFNIPATIQEINENSIPGREGVNDFDHSSYGGPCPPSGEHRYFFKLYALDKKLILADGVTKNDLEEAMKGHILSKAELVGLYKKVYE